MATRRRARHVGAPGKSRALRQAGPGWNQGEVGSARGWKTSRERLSPRGQRPERGASAPTLDAQDAPRMSRPQRSPIIIAGALVLPEVTKGMMAALASRNP